MAKLCSFKNRLPSKIKKIEHPHISFLYTSFYFVLALITATETTKKKKNHKIYDNFFGTLELKILL